jgi:hypothetical protein
LITGTDNFASVIGQVELSYTPSSISQVRAGVLRTVEPTSIFKYVGITRVYVGIDQTFLQRFSLNVSAQYDYLSYGQAIPSFVGLPAGARRDNDVIGKIGVSYRIKPWIIVTVDDSTDLRWSGYRLPVAYSFNDVFLRQQVLY